jgi:hypothetical protein
MFARRKLRRRVPTMSHREAMSTMRSMSAAGSRDAKTLLMLAQRGVDTAPDDDSRYQAERWRDVYAAGRLVKTAAFPMRLLSWGGVDIRLVDEIESIFEEGEAT